MSTSSINVTQGILNLPGSTPASKKATEQLLFKDHSEHHCFFRSVGLHNHLSHHLLAAYDLGASEELIRAVYEKEASDQRPILLGEETGVVKPGSVTKENWKEYLGNAK